MPPRKNTRRPPAPNQRARKAAAEAKAPPRNAANDRKRSHVPSPASSIENRLSRRESKYRGTKKTTLRPAAPIQRSKRLSRRRASSRQKEYRDTLSDSEDSYNNSPSEDDSDEYQRGTPKRRSPRRLSPKRQRKKKKISPKKLSDFVASRQQKSYKDNPLKICLRYAFDNKGSTNRVPKVPKADGAYTRTFRSGLKTNSTYNQFYDFITSELIPKDKTIAEYQSASVFYDSTKVSAQPYQSSRIEHSTKIGVEPISSDSEFLMALVETGTEAYGQGFDPNASPTSNNSDSDDVESKIVVLDILICTVKAKAKSSKSKRTMPTQIRIKISDLVVREVVEDGVSSLISSTTKYFGEILIGYDEFHRLHIGQLRKMLLAEYQKKGRDLNDIGKKSTLFLKNKFRPHLAMCKIKRKDELKMHIENLLTLISLSTYNNHVAGGLVDRKPTMNITLALGF